MDVKLNSKQLYSEGKVVPCFCETVLERKYGNYGFGEFKEILPLLSGHASRCCCLHIQLRTTSHGPWLGHLKTISHGPWHGHLKTTSYRPQHGHLNVKRQHSQATTRRDTQGHSDLVTLLSDKDTGLGDGRFAEPASEQTTGKAL